MKQTRRNSGTIMGLEKGRTDMIYQQTRLGRPRVSPEDLDAQQVAELPGRAALSLVNANLAAPINAALALNVLSDNSAAAAGALQDAPIYQGMMGALPAAPAVPL